MRSLRYAITPRLAVACLAIVAAAAALGALLLFFPAYRTWLLLSVSALLALLPIVSGLARKKFDMLEPITLMAVTYFIIYVIRPAYNLLHGNFTYAGIDISSTFDLMLVTVTLGWIAAVIGYYAPIGSRLAGKFPRPADQWRRKAVLGATAILLALLVGTWVVFVVANGGPGILHGRTQAIANSFEKTGAYLPDSVVLFIPISLLAIGLGRPTTLGRVAVCLLGVAGAVALGVGTGDRHFLVYLGLSLGTLYYVRRNARPSPLMVGAVAFVGLVALLTIGATRYHMTEANPVAVATNAFKNPPADLDTLLTSEDTGMATAVAAELTVVPRATGYWYGRASLLDLLARPVPRVIWHQKPASGRLTVLQRLWGPSACTYGGQCSTFGAYGDFYLDGGLIGVVVGFALLGVFFRSAYEYYRSSPSNSFVQVVYAITLPFSALYFIQIFVDLTSLLIFLVPPIVIIALLAHERGFGSARAALSE